MPQTPPNCHRQTLYALLFHDACSVDHNFSSLVIVKHVKSAERVRSRCACTVSAVSYQPVERNGLEMSGSVQARRSGSVTKLVSRSNGEVVVERTSSDKNRNSGSTLPIILPGGVKSSNAEPVLSAVDVLEKIGGKGAAGAYSEHLFSIEALAEKFQVQINVADVTKSTWLLAQQARSLLEEYGPNVLPPPRMPLWLVFLLQFTNFFMVSCIFILC